MVTPLITAQAASDMAAMADTVHVDEAVLGYVSEIAAESRRARQVRLGLSVRGCLSYIRVAKTWAAADGRHYVVPDDIKELAIPVMSHRLLLDPEAEFNGVEIETVIAQLLADVAPPVNRVA